MGKTPFCKTSPHEEQEWCKSSAGLFRVLNETFNHSTINLFYMRHFKLSRDKNESADEWMGHLRVKASEYNYKELIGNLKINLSME